MDSKEFRIKYCFYHLKDYAVNISILNTICGKILSFEEIHELYKMILDYQIDIYGEQLRKHNSKIFDKIKL